MESRSSGRRSEARQGYAGYGAEPDISQSKAKVTKSLERDLTLAEYRDDRDVILTAIKDALRERRYSDAQEFVFKYRAAAASDEIFEQLAKMTAKGLEEDKTLEKLKVSLEATPEDDYQVRLSLCERIYRIRKDPKVLEDVNKYRAYLNKPLVKEEDGLPGPLDLKDQAPKVARTMADTALAVLCGLMVSFAVIVGTIALGLGDAHGKLAFALALVQIAVHVITMVNWRKKKYEASSYIVKFVGNILFFITMIAIIASLAVVSL